MPLEDAPVAADTPAALARPVHEAAHTEHSSGRGSLGVARWAGDALALLSLVGVLLYWEPFDGGRERDALIVVGWLILLAAPVAVREAARLDLRLRLLLVWYGLGGTAAVLTAVERSGWVRAAVIYGIAPILGLLARRLWRRSWGPHALIVLLVLSFGAYTYRSWLQWWGSTMTDIQPLWMPLSWRNQSGALTGAFGLLFTGIALASRRVVRGGAALLAGLAFAELWLSSSRGALAFTGASLVVVAVIAVRSGGTRGWRAAATTTAGIAAAAVVIAAALTAMLPEGASTPLDSRDQEAIQNAVARINHVEAAARMFVDRPVAGKGLGSYRVVALDFTDPDANLTSSAHNEYVEVLGEGGLVFGLSFILLAGAVALAIARRVRDGVVIDTTAEIVDLRGATFLGLVGVTAVIGAHSAFDFDWTYPVLPALFALGAGPLSVTSHEDPTEPDATRSRARSLWAAPLALLLAFGLVGDLVERSQTTEVGLSAEQYAASGTPWHADQRGDIAARLMADGELVLAREVVEDALRWNPANDRLRRIRNLVRYEQGELTSEQLADTLVPGESRFQSYVDVADWVAQDGDFVVALGVVNEVIEQMQTYSSWGTNEMVIDVGIRQIFYVTQLEGCAGARRMAEEVASRPAAATYRNIDEVMDMAVRDACEEAAARS